VEQISNHISWAEAVKSQTAIRLGISNIPNPSQIARMKLLAERIFEPVREHFGKPIYVSSFYRSSEVNKKIGGSPNSQHMASRGAAMDLDAQVLGGITNKEIFNYILNNLDFDQLIWEFGDNDEPEWVHVSYVNPEENRHQVLRAYSKNGKTVYAEK